MDRLEQILAVLHDLKSPVLAIRRLAECLLDDEQLSEDERRKLRLIHESALEASDHLKNIDLSAGAGRQEDADAEAVEAAALARDVVDRFEPHAESKNQELQYLPPEVSEPCVVHGCPSQIREAMKNLVSNALKYSDRGQTVEVWVGRFEDTVYFSVSDDGPGLSESDQERLFEPFQQLGPSPTGEEESSGVGLYIVKKIVERHGGDIEVESAPDSGSTFTLLFPVAEDAPSPSTSSRSPSSDRSSAPRELGVNPAHLTDRPAVS